MYLRYSISNGCDYLYLSDNPREMTGECRAVCILPQSCVFPEFHTVWRGFRPFFSPQKGGTSWPWAKTRHHTIVVFRKYSDQSTVRAKDFMLSGVLPLNMSETEGQIKCRRCQETISLNVGNCPHCGQSIRSDVGPMVAIVLGVLLVIGAALNISELLIFGLVGLALAALGGYVLYDKRKRISEASGEAQTEFSIGEKVE